MNESSYSDGLSRKMVWLSGVVASYQHGEEVFERIGHQHVPHSSLWRQTQRHGERMKSYVEEQQARTAPERIKLARPEQDHQQIKGVTVDGGMVNIRREGWKEFKVGAVFDVEIRTIIDRKTREEVEQPCAVNTQYTAVLSEWQNRLFVGEAWRIAMNLQRAGLGDHAHYFEALLHEWAGGQDGVKW